MTARGVSLRQRLRVLRDLTALGEDDRAAMAELLRFASVENIRPRTAATISDDAMISPLASIRFAERVAIGPRTHVGPFCCVWGGWSNTWTRIGADVLLSPGVVLVAGNHGTEGSVPVRDLPFIEKDVEIADGAWIGAHAVVVGCRVGAGAVVGAGSVVLSDVPDLAIAAGSPARVIASRGG